MYQFNFYKKNFFFRIFLRLIKILKKGNILFFSDGLDFPKLTDEIEKNFGLLEEASG